jgi:hypothetical protein
MNSLKKTETVVTLFNTAALLGASIYFYRKINNLELELNKHSEHLTSTVKKVREIAIYKKHIAILGNAIKELNNSVASQNRDIETLKELVKIQSNQINELQMLVHKNLKGEKEEAIEIKHKDNPYLQALNPYYQQNFRQQNARPQIQNRPVYPQQNNEPLMEPQYNFQSQNQQGNQTQGYNNLNQGNQGQGYNNLNQGNQGQGYNNLNQHQGFPNQNFPGMQNQGFMNFNPGMQNQGRNNQFSDDNLEDEDATIAAVRNLKANQQNNPDLLNMF